MRIQEAEDRIRLLREQAEADMDTCLVVYFSREEDSYRAYQNNMSMGDALIVIEGLINTFGLSPLAIAGMGSDEDDDEDDGSFIAPVATLYAREGH